MSEPSDGGPAFPITGQMSDDGKLIFQCSEPGMSLRDWFAGQASESGVRFVLESYLEVVKTNEPEVWEHLAYSDQHCDSLAMIEARYRYALADAMLKERIRNIRRSG